MVSADLTAGVLKDHLKTNNGEDSSDQRFSLTFISSLNPFKCLKRISSHLCLHRRA